MRRFILLLLYFPISFFSFECPKDYKSQKIRGFIHNFQWKIEEKIGYYYLLDDTLQDIFSGGGKTGRVEIDCHFQSLFSLWLDAGYFQKTGRALNLAALGLDQKIVMKLASTTLGLKMSYPFGKYYEIYLGGGPRIFFLFLNNHSSFVQRHQHRFGLGGGVLGGLKIFAPKPYPFFVDFFVDYSKKTMHFPTNSKTTIIFDMNISGLTIGGALGWHF